MLEPKRRLVQGVDPGVYDRAVRAQQTVVPTLRVAAWPVIRPGLGSTSVSRPCPSVSWTCLDAAKPTEKTTSRARRTRSNRSRGDKGEASYLRNQCRGSHR